MTIGSMITNKSITVVIDNKMKTVPSSHPAFNDLRELMKTVGTKDEETIKREISDLLDIKAYVEKKSYGRLIIADDGVYYDGKKVKDVIAERMFSMFSEGFDVTPLVNFYENVKKNPIKSVEEELYLFLEANEISITPDGHILAFKKVKDDYHDFYSGKFRHKIGDSPEMPREEVNSNRNETCSSGLHFCSMSYLPHYNGGTGRVMIVKINPEDVISIPFDYNNAKGRACKYLVVDEVEEEFVGEALGLGVDRRYPEGNGGYADEEFYENVDSDEDWNEPENEEDVYAEDDEKTWVHRGRRFSVSKLSFFVNSEGIPSSSKKFSIPQSTLRDFMKRVS